MPYKYDCRSKVENFLSTGESLSFLIVWYRIVSPYGAPYGSQSLKAASIRDEIFSLFPFFPRLSVCTWERAIHTRAREFPLFPFSCCDMLYSLARSNAISIDKDSKLNLIKFLS